MKTIKILLQTTLIMLLVLSCTNNEGELEIPKQAFDYSLHYNFIKENELLNTSEILSSKVENNTNLLENINMQYNTDLSFPEEFLNVTNINLDELENYLIENKLISPENLKLVHEFENELKSSDFETALKEYQNKIISLSLTDNEFQEHNLFVNTLKTIDYYNPETFNNSTKTLTAARISWACAKASILLTASSESMASCATGVACAGAIMLFSLSLTNHMEACGW